VSAPVVLGSVYGHATRPPKAAPLEVVYQPPDDEDSAVRRVHVELPGGNQITLDDETLTIKFAGTEVVVAKDGDVTVKSNANVKIESKGDVEITAQGNLALSAQRMRHGFYSRWVLNPQRVDPETKMPRFSDDEGKTPLSDHFDGKASEQFEAIWQYLQSVGK